MDIAVFITKIALIGIGNHSVQHVFSPYFWNLTSPDIEMNIAIIIQVLYSNKYFM